MRAWPRFALLFPILLLAADADADVDLGGGSIVFETQLPDENNDGEFVEVTDELRIREFFNKANCECGAVFNVQMDLEGNMGSVPSEEVELWVGSSCDTRLTNDVNCCSRFTSTFFGVCPESLTSFDTQVIASQFVDREVTVQAWVDPTDGDCTAGGSGIEATSSLFAMIDPEKDGMYDAVYNHEISFDTKPPPAVENIELASGEEALEASWDLPAGNDDIRFFQLLCARADDTFDEADDFPRKKALYRIASNVCPELGIEPPTVEPITGAMAGPTIDAGPMIDAGPTIDAGPMIDAGAADAGTTPPAEGIFTLDPDFVCGEAQQTSTSIRVQGLENGVQYRVVLAVIDEARNARFINLGVVTPAAVTDFWEDYKDQGGTADGGFCFVATASYGDYDHPFVRVLRDFRDGTLAKFGLGRAFIAWYYRNSPEMAAFIRRHPVARAISAVLLFPLVVAAGLWEYTGIIGKLLMLAAIVWFVRRRRKNRRERPESEPRRSRRRRKLAVAIGAGLLALISATAIASAQTPWWDDQEEIPEQEGSGPAWWNFELKFGPYFPDVDSEFSMEGPFERMYGDGPFLMTQIELERFFLQQHGQLGVGVMAGFLGTSANAFALDDNGNTDFGNRSPGDKTKFRLIPTAVHAVYRFTDLDEEMGIPLVPYGKLGLSYYLWYVTSPSGDIAEVDGDKARGGSLGWQGTVGLALRAERFDPDAEVSLRTELGITHAGVFAELTYAQVDGFGSDSKLSVGDLTWFGGINFEF